MTAWAVWFNDHIHTSFDKGLAIFATRAAAVAWKRQYGFPGCTVVKITVKK